MKISNYTFLFENNIGFRTNGVKISLPQLYETLTAGETQQKLYRFFCIKSEVENKYLCFNSYFFSSILFNKAICSPLSYFL